MIEYGCDYPDTQTFVDQDGTVHGAPDNNGQLSSDLLAGLRDGAWLDQQRFPPLTYAVPAIIPEGFTLLVGAPKIGKSWFVLACALAVAVGGKALGALAVDRRPVLYLALEDGHRRLQERSRVLLADDPIPLGFEYLISVQPGTVQATVAEWLDRHRDAAPFVILDTLGRVMPPSLSGESAYQRDYRIGSQLKRLADDHPSACLLVNHHDRKAESSDFVDSVSGTHGLAGSADTLVILTRDRHETAGLLMVTGRDVLEGEFAVTFRPDSAWTLDGADLTEAAGNAAKTRATAGVGDRSAEVIGYVMAHPDGVRRGQVAKDLAMDPGQAGVYLCRAVDSGRLARAARGLYTPVISVTSVTSSGSPGNVTRNT